MKKYMIFADSSKGGPKYVFSNCLSRARQYAEEMVRDFEPGTNVHILVHKATARIGLNWGETLPKTPVKKAKARKLKLVPNTNPVPKGNGKGGWHPRWTTDDDKTLMSMIAAGKNRREIAIKLNRTVAAVLSRAATPHGVSALDIPK